MHGLMTVAHSLKQVCDDLDFIAKDAVPPQKRLMNECNNTVLDASQVVKSSALAVIEMVAANETLRNYITMMMDFISEKNLLSEYSKFTEQYE